MTTGGIRSNVSGFTLVELLATIAVAAILLTMVVPSFRSLTVSTRLTTQANDMVAAINLARSDAIKRNGNVTLCRAGSDTATACSTGTSTWQYWIVRASTGTIVRRGSINAYNNTITVSSTLTADQVVFSSDGLARTGSALVSDRQITICSSSGLPNNIRRIVLGAGSRISTQSLSGGC